MSLLTMAFSCLGACALNECSQAQRPVALRGIKTGAHCLVDLVKGRRRHGRPIHASAMARKLLRQQVASQPLEGPPAAMPVPNADWQEVLDVPAKIAPPSWHPAVAS